MSLGARVFEMLRARGHATNQLMLLPRVLLLNSQRILPLLLFLLISECTGGVDLEATLIAVDNSAYMINGDHRPNRLQCQHECVNLISQVKTQNPENTVGLMTMACLPSECPRVRVTPAVNQEIGPILLTLHEINKTPRHKVQFEKAMKAGWMALKHRMNKNQRPRIVALVGSPLEIHDEPELVRWGRKLRKNNVAVDIISFGESPEVNAPALQAFVNAVCKDGNSRLLHLPPEACPPGGLSDALFSSPILRDPDADKPGAPATQPDLAEFGGVDPELDPELAMALKMSAQEEKERIEREAQKEKAALARSAAAAKEEQREGGGGAGEGPAGEEGATREGGEAGEQEAGEGGGGGGGAGGAGDGEGDALMEDEEAMLQKALELSLRDSQRPPGEGDAGPDGAGDT